jgi:hypothetical protein
MKMKKTRLILPVKGSDVLKLYSLFLCFLLLASCSSKNTYTYSPCQEKCRYAEQDCMELCGQNSISLSFDYSSSGITRVSSCSDRCGNLYKRCMEKCSLERGDGE